MDINHLATAVVTLMSQVVINQGSALLEKVGQEAFQKARSVTHRTLAQLRGQPTTARTAERFERQPAKIAGSLEMDLEELLTENEAFRQEVIQLLQAYQQAANSYQSTTMTNSGSNVGGDIHTGGGHFAGRDLDITNFGGDYVAGDKFGGDQVAGDKITHTSHVDSGAAATGDHSTAVGERGVNVTGGVSGPIVTGSGNVINIGPSGEPIDPTLTNLPPVSPTLRPNMLEYLSRSEIKTIAFDMQIDYDRLPGENLDEKVLSLIQTSQRQNRVAELVALCRHTNDSVAWS